MLQNAYFLAKIGEDTAENEQHFAAFSSIPSRMMMQAALGPPEQRGGARAVADRAAGRRGGGRSSPVEFHRDSLRATLLYCRRSAAASLGW